jgi:hypothetical protein
MISFKRLISAILMALVSFGISAQSQYSLQKFKPELLNDPAAAGKQLERKFNSMTISKFEPDSFMKCVLLENGYAKSKIINATQWPPKEKKYRVVEVQSVYTQYPKDKDFWLTNYHTLLADRLKELFVLDPTLNDKRIEWTMVLQTACNSEAQAQKMFHGFAIYYAPIIEDTVPPKPRNFTKVDSMTFSKGYDEVQRFVLDNVFAKERRETDSTVFKVLNRHPEWKKSVVVCDWTSSMYAYGSQAALWHSLNYKRSGIRYMSLFNDGGNRNNFGKKIGATNGIFFADADNIKRLVRMYKEVMADGDGGDEPENDIEALSRAIRHYPDAKEIILIADNSCIRDFCLINRITKPIKVILCGTKNGINPQYLNLAYRTGGSFYTIESDIEDLRKNVGEGSDVKVEAFDFIYDNDKNGFVFKTAKPTTVPDCSEYDSAKKCVY